MKKWLHRPFEAYYKVLLPTLVLIFYLLLLVGRQGLGRAHLPALALAGLALAGLLAARLQRQANLWTRLRADAPALLLGGLVLLALALRLWRAPAARPAPGSDEAYFVEAVLDVIRSGSYIPASLRYPTLTTYGELAVSVLRFLTGVSAKLWTWPSELETGHLYGWSRAAVALLGALSLLPLYALAERLYAQRAALLASFFLALLPLHMQASATIAPEVPAALLCTLAVYLALRLFEQRRPGWALGAGACAGLAAASHYPAGLVLLAPLLAVWMPRPGAAVHRQVRQLFGAGGDDRAVGEISAGTAVLLLLAAALLAFVVACPAVIFKLDRLVAGLAEAVRAYFPAEGRAGTGLRYLLQQGLGYGPALLVLFGGALLLPCLRRRDLLVLAFPLLLYLALLLPRARFPRDLVLLSPWMALLAGLGVDRMTAWAQQRWPGPAWLQRWLPWGLGVLAGSTFLLALWRA